MGKRSNFERVERDFYPTPYEAVVPLLPFLMPFSLIHEPCAGAGALVDYLARAGFTIVCGSDIEPLRADILKADATTLKRQLPGPNYTFVTNPPWTRAILHAIIANLAPQASTWLLFDADWIHTRQCVPFLPLLRKIVSVGRVKWIEDSPFTGKDNCAWHLFHPGNGPTEFYGPQSINASEFQLDL